MKRILVVGEDDLCCALGARLVDACLPDWQVARTISTGGVSNLWESMPRYRNFARTCHPVLCIADTDGKCVLRILSARHNTWAEDTHLLLRLAVTEAESWVLADRERFAQEFSVPFEKIPRFPDEEADPKRQLLMLAKRSKKRIVRMEMVKAGHNAGELSQGAGYNVHLCSFVRNCWRAHQAEQNSPSLKRAMRRLSALSS
jgi:hypothetical protein